ncbi:MAG: helix-turn-helix domain-containing protein [Prevotella sp.]|nr:helix-turn-helix domain-containing protein [Prevotella sp.]
MTKQEYEDRIAELEHQVEELRLTQFDLVNRNMLLAQQLDVYYDVRRRIQMLKELVIRHKELLRHADLRDDDELMAIIETKLEESLAYQDPDYSLKEVAELVGTTQTRIVELFRRSPVHKTVDDYLDYLRLLRSMYYLQEKPMWGVAACAQEAGFSVIRTFNRKFQDAIGMTPHEFRMLLADGRNNMQTNNQ